MSAWQAVAATDEDGWTEEYLTEALDSFARNPLPPHEQKIGEVSASWTELFPGTFHIAATGGTLDDRRLTRIIVGTQLRAYGLTEATFTAGGPSLLKTAGWSDIMTKARRLIETGKVQISGNEPDTITATVEGDHGTYDVEIMRQDPNSGAVTNWTCGCPWNQFAWQRTRGWKPLEGRMCSHALATQWQASATPLDTQYDPEAQAQVGPGGQLGFDAPGMAPSGQATLKPKSVPAPAAPDQQLSIPGIAPGTAEATPPAPPGSGIIPPFPQPPMPAPVSIPGGKLPDPFNPMQMPGGTFSKVADWDFSDGPKARKAHEWGAKIAAKGDTYENSEMVRLEVEEYGIAEGKSEAHGSGQYRLIPKNSIGEVLGQDRTTGFVDVIFPLNDSGPMEPYHLRCWILPENLTKMPNLKKPGPFIRRR